MITPLEVYLVMQLDSIKVMLIIACVITGVVMLVFSIASLENNFDGPIDMKRYKKLSLMFVFFVTTATLTPDSKTTAAMIILPALTSKSVTEPLAAEGKELYQLAKRALTDLVDEPKLRREPESKE